MKKKKIATLLNFLLIVGLLLWGLDVASIVVGAVVGVTAMAAFPYVLAVLVVILFLAFVGLAKHVRQHDRLIDRSLDVTIEHMSSLNRTDKIQRGAQELLAHRIDNVEARLAKRLDVIEKRLTDLEDRPPTYAPRIYSLVPPPDGNSANYHHPHNYRPPTSHPINRSPESPVTDDLDRLTREQLVKNLNSSNTRYFFPTDEDLD